MRFEVYNFEFIVILMSMIQQNAKPITFFLAVHLLRRRASYISSFPAGVKRV